MSIVRPPAFIATLIALATVAIGALVILSSRSSIREKGELVSSTDGLSGSSRPASLLRK
jgi:hypothetical protein